jgi:hypothetical protein
LIPLLVGRDAGSGTDRDLYERAHGLFEQRSPQEVPVAVSMVAVGEAFTQLARNFPALPLDAPDPPSSRFFRLARDGKLEVCWLDDHAPRGRLLQLAEEIRTEAPRVGGTDALIVACALLCRHCTTLYSPDRELQTNVWLRRRCLSGARPLQIEDPPRPRRRGG